jgi:hypothetical protein
MANQTRSITEPKGILSFLHHVANEDLYADNFSSSEQQENMVTSFGLPYEKMKDAFNKIRDTGGDPSSLNRAVDSFLDTFVSPVLQAQLTADASSQSCIFASPFTALLFYVVNHNEFRQKFFSQNRGVLLQEFGLDKKQMDALLAINGKPTDPQLAAVRDCMRDELCKMYASVW